MPARSRIGLLLLLTAVFPAAGGHDTVRQEMKFGAEAAQQGLWREAEFRWRKILKDDPDNAHVHNNLAVAFESIGDFDRARDEYEEALRLAPASKEIHKNYESFLELCKLIKSCRGDRPAATPAEGPQPSPSPDAGAPATEPAPSPSPQP